MPVNEHDVGSTFGDEELQAIRHVLSSKESLSWGSEKALFEREFAAYCGARHAVAVTSCTAALHTCAQVLRLGPGDEVVCTPQSFWATAVALVARGVTMRFADINPLTLNIDPATIEPQITPNTRAIYVMHYGGNPVDMAAVRAIADAHGVPVVEDCAHASGAAYRGAPVGNGDLCCFSFHSLKNMTTLGEGGMLTTNNEEWAEEVTQLRTMGIVGRTEPRETTDIGPYPKPDFPIADHAAGSWDLDWTRIDEVGTNLRMSTVVAAVGRVQLRKLDGFIAARARVAERYTEAVESIAGLRGPLVAPGDTNAWHLYPCFIEPEAGVEHTELIRFMQQERGVQIILRFWPLHLHNALRARGHEFGECPVCEKVWFEQQINLPICPDMEKGEVSAVCEALAEGMEKCRA